MRCVQCSLRNPKYIPAQGALPITAQHVGSLFRELARCKKREIRGGTADGGSCHQAAFNSAEVLHIADDGVYKRQERHPHCQDLWREGGTLRGGTSGHG